MAFKKTYRKKARKTYKRKSYAKKGKRTSPMKKMVRAVVTRMAEKKETEAYYLSNVLYNSAAAAAATFDANNVYLPVTFPTQGAGQGQRVGNKITVNKLTFKGTMVPTVYDATTNPAPCPVQVKMVAFYDRQDPTFNSTTPTPQTNQNLLQLGGSAQGLQNDLVDMWGQFNTDRYAILKTQTFKLGFSAFPASVGGDPASGNFSNNDFKYNANFSWDLTKHIPKVMTFNDTTTNATSRGVWVMFIVSKANGGQFASNHIPVGIQLVQTLSYTDM